MESVAVNRKAFHDYFIVEEFEAGIELLGAEIKAVRLRKLNLQDSFVKIKNNEAFLINSNIAVYEKTSKFDFYDSTRSRKLLLHKKEIDKIRGKIEEKGFTMVPLSAYFNKKNFLKIKIALVKGKHNFDKRQILKEKDIAKEMRKEFKKNMKI